MGSCAAMAYFFFQAEDGIRDIGVTGVQTCALPISVLACGIIFTFNSTHGITNVTAEIAGQHTMENYFKIGRASCRGKSVDLGGRRIIKKKKRREICPDLRSS